MKAPGEGNPQPAKGALGTRRSPGKLEHPDSEPVEVRPGTHDKGTRKLKYSSLLEAQNYGDKLGGQLATFFLEA